MPEAPIRPGKMYCPKCKNPLAPRYMYPKQTACDTCILERLNELAEGATPEELERANKRSDEEAVMEFLGAGLTGDDLERVRERVKKLVEEAKSKRS